MSPEESVARMPLIHRIMCGALGRLQSNGFLPHAHFGLLDAFPGHLLDLDVPGLDLSCRARPCRDDCHEGFHHDCHEGFHQAPPLSCLSRFDRTRFRCHVRGHCILEQGPEPGLKVRFHSSRSQHGHFPT